MEEKVEKRNSSFELLRIIAMFAIILHHYVAHSDYFRSYFENFPVPICNTLFLEIITFGGKFGIYIFVLISGYFLIKSEFKLKRIISLIIKTTFYATVIDIFLIGFNFKELDWKVFRNFFPILWSRYWFIRYYIVLNLLSPFINKFIKACTKEDLKKFLMIALISYSVFNTVILLGIGIIGEIINISELYMFVIMYIVGGYIRLYCPEFSQESKKKIKNCFWMFLFLIIIILLLTNYLDIEIYKKFSFKFFTRSINFDTFPVVMLPIFTFLIFKNMKIKENKFINLVGKTTFGIYLFHDNNSLRDVLWNKIFPNINYIESNFLVIHVILKCVSIFVIASLIDMLYNYFIQDCIDKYIVKKENKMKVKT